MNMTKKLIGDTLKVTWVSSGVTPSTLYSALYDGSDTLVSSLSMTGSGNGHYFSEHTVPNSQGFYVAETLAMVNTKPYKNRLRFKAVTGEAD